MIAFKLKRKNWLDKKKTGKVLGGWGEGGMKMWSTDDFQGSKNTVWHHHDGYMYLYICPSP